MLLKVLFVIGLATSLFSSSYFKNEFEIHLGSYHSNKIYNNENYGFGWNYNFTEDIQSNVGLYKNSQSNISAYGGLSYYFYKKSRLKLGIGGVLATNYYNYDDYGYIKSKPLLVGIGGLVASYNFLDNVGLKIMATSDRFLTSGKNATDLIHASLVFGF